MKKLYIYTIISAVILAMTACTQREDVQIPNPTHRVTITASTEGGDDTKALMGDENEDGSRSILWEPGDSIRILSDRGADMDNNFLFVNNTPENSKIATFEGEISEEVYEILASYPYTNRVNYVYNDHWNGENWVYESFYTIHLPRTQRYRENNFDRKAFPMVCYKVGTANATNAGVLDEFGTFEFKNLCGVLALNLVGEISVKSITMSATSDSSGMSVPASLSGYGTLKKDIDSYYILDMNGNSSVTLECPDVQLDPEIPTPFHIVLPPATYTSFNLTITTSDGRIMLVNVDKELTINRSKAKHTTPLTYVESVAINLSERGTSNSYIVPQAGVYKFKADVIGNGADGIIGGANFHTTDPSISPEIVKILWNENSAIAGVGLNKDDGYISFTAPGNKGNALIAAMDADSTIIWSWHIWCTDTPEEHTYINNEDQTFIVLDRNIGATRADRGIGEEWKESVGLHYQWGRKDPFTVGHQNSDNTFTIDRTIKYPTVIASWRWIETESSGVYLTYNQLWSDSLKTIYDPCPVGYKVAPKATWTGFSKKGVSDKTTDIEDFNVSGAFDNGYNFIYDGVNTAWYPVTISDGHHIYGYNFGTDGKYWSSTSFNTNDPYHFYFNYRDEFNYDLSIRQYSSGYINAVRCVADEGFVDRTLPTITLDNITAVGYESARVTATVSVPEGVAEVTEAGFVWGISRNPTIESSLKASVDTLDGEFSYDIIGLDDFTTYYVRAYAINENGTAYSEEESFTTTYNGPIIDLSESGTANCYIVLPTTDHYSIDLSVIGNGSKGIIEESNFHTSDPSIDPASIAVLWAQTYNSYWSTSSSKELLSFIEFNKEKKILHFVPTGVEGNLLIAAKDKDDNIIWSWHLWITDQPADQTYINHEGVIYSVLDRNIGATRANRGSGEEWRESVGMHYQWGRKDPFTVGYLTADAQFSIDRSIKNPTRIVSNWDGWMLEPRSQRAWDDTTKTIYDPCPVGYRVMSDQAWTGFSTTGLTLWNNNTNYETYNVAGSFDKGWNFKISESSTAWYPTTSDNSVWGVSFGENSGRYWSSVNNGDTQAYSLYFYFVDEFTTNSLDLRAECTSYLNPVRCVVDQDHQDIAFPYVTTISIENVTSDSAEASAELVSEGADSVTERGFVYATQENPTIANSVVPVSADGSFVGSYKATIDGLIPGTTYYIRAYATNSHGTSYGKSIIIRTKDGGEGEGYDRDDDFEW